MTGDVAAHGGRLGVSGKREKELLEKSFKGEGGKRVTALQEGDRLKNKSAAEFSR